MIAALEKGRREEITLGELIVLSDALQQNAAAWFEGSGWLQLTRFTRT